MLIELIREREEKRDQRFPIVRLEHQHVDADTFGLHRLV
jgi:hypothetical protein